jgi:hypothetical protein
MGKQLECYKDRPVLGRRTKLYTQKNNRDSPEPPRLSLQTLPVRRAT